MKTKHVPVLCMLMAGAICLVLDIVQGMDISTLARDFLISLLIFFVIGTVVRVILDKVFNPKEPDPEAVEKEDFDATEEGGEEGSEASGEGAPEEEPDQTAEEEDTEGF